MVPTTGLEPVRCYSLEPESSASANSATWAQGANVSLNTHSSTPRQAKSSSKDYATTQAYASVAV